MLRLYKLWPKEARKMIFWLITNLTRHL